MKPKYILFICSLALASCTSSKISTSWKTDGAELKKDQQILILAITDEPDRAIQKEMETHIANDLKRKGYLVNTSLELFGPKTFTDIDNEKTQNILKNSSIKYFLNVSLINKYTESYCVRTGNYGPINSIFRPYPDPFMSLDCQTLTQNLWETNIFDIENEKLIYSSQTKTFDPIELQLTAHFFSKVLIRDMKKNGIYK